MMAFTDFFEVQAPYPRELSPGWLRSRTRSCWARTSRTSRTPTPTKVILDSSAVLAIMKGEPEDLAFARLIHRADPVRISAATLLELSIVFDGYRDPVTSRRLDEFLATAGVEVVEVTEEQARIGREAYRDFGRGSRRPARFNFGDCFSYALAKVSDEPLLFKGDDFTHTDVRPAAD